MNIYETFSNKLSKKRIIERLYADNQYLREALVEMATSRGVQLGRCMVLEELIKLVEIRVDDIEKFEEVKNERN